MKNILPLLMIIVVVAIIAAGFACLVATHQPKCASSPTQPLSDTEYMRIGINNYLMSNFDHPFFPPPDYDVSLEDIAVKNAVEGKDLLIPTSANTAGFNRDFNIDHPSIRQQNFCSDIIFVRKNI